MVFHKAVIVWTAVLAASVYIPKVDALVTKQLIRRLDNEFNFNWPVGCDDYCEDSTFRSCIPNGVIDFSCACTLSGLQDIANCASCAWQAPEGKLYVNTTFVTFTSFMSSWLDSCYDKGYVIQAGDYSSLVAQATYATEASSPSSTAYPSTTSPRGSTPSAAPSSSRPSSNVASQQYNLTGGLSNLVQQDFASGVCNFYYFSAISPEYGFCIGSGSAIFPSSECSGTSCTIDASTPKLGWGLAGDLSLPSSLVCDGVVHTVAEGLDIGVAINAGKGSDPFYACACNGPINSVPDICQGVCGAACETGLKVPTTSLSCNVAYRCSGGPSYNIREINNDTCTVPKLVGMTSGSVDYILDNDGLIDCSGTSVPVGSCPGSNPENTSGSRVCSCNGPASGVDTCGSGQNLADSGSSNNTGNGSGRGGSSGSGSGTGTGTGSGSGSGTNGAPRLVGLTAIWGSVLTTLASFLFFAIDV